jgi:hypothetical protein
LEVDLDIFISSCHEVEVRHAVMEMFFCRRDDNIKSTLRIIKHAVAALG